MPYTIKSQNNKFCLFKKGEFIPIKGGCFDDKAEAEAKMKALYSAEGDYAIAESYLEEAKRALEPIEEEFFFSETSFNGDLEYKADPDAEEFSWQGPIAYEEVLTGDHRIFKTGAISWDAESLPWPYRYQRASTQGHAGCVPIGRVDHIERQEGGVIYGYGVIIPSLNDEAAEYMRLMKANAAGGCSIDGDSAEFDVQDLGEGKTRIEFSSMRLRSVTAVDLPAFHEAQIDLTEGDNEELARKIRRGKLEHLHEITASGDDLTLESISEFAAEDWEIVNWGGEKGFCLKKKGQEGGEVGEPELTKPLKCFPTEEEAKGYLDSLSIVPEETLPTVSWLPDDTSPDLEVVIASAIPVKPPIEWFQEPKFEHETALKVTKEGAVYGHLATWGKCHIGFQGACVTPPKGSSYKYFHTGELETQDGDCVEVGHLTFNTGHASMTDNAKNAAAHYDHTGTVAADVRVGEDQHGIWVVGALRSTLSDEDIRAFRAAPLSGDWRRIAGRLELISALAVNVPGFPVPRARSLVAGGESQVLIYTESAKAIEPLDEYEEGLRYAKRNQLQAQVEEFHLVGQHDQGSHGRGGGGGGGAKPNYRKALKKDVGEKRNNSPAMQKVVRKGGRVRLRKLSKTPLSSFKTPELHTLSSSLGDNISASSRTRNTAKWSLNPVAYAFSTIHERKANQQRGRVIDEIARREAGGSESSGEMASYLQAFQAEEADISWATALAEAKKEIAKGQGQKPSKDDMAGAYWFIDSVISDGVDAEEGITEEILSALKEVSTKLQKEEAPKEAPKETPKEASKEAPKKSSEVKAASYSEKLRLERKDELAHRAQ